MNKKLDSDRLAARIALQSIHDLPGFTVNGDGGAELNRTIAAKWFLFAAWSVLAGEPLDSVGQEASTALDLLSEAILRENTTAAERAAADSAISRRLSAA